MFVWKDEYHITIGVEEEKVVIEFILMEDETRLVGLIFDYYDDGEIEKTRVHFKKVK
ncbi:hypothetical protein LCGC14_2924610 [marine sediment metagenome]|uniref:Uncharacterized protein n=1 Tax=marine sediment metagenome TaxID=412755 RepID=A0A0F9ADV4_9ZZZZ